MKPALRSAYVFLLGCEAKCGNCDKLHHEHHYPSSHNCGECKRIITTQTCKRFRGWREYDGCDACRRTLAERMFATAPAANAEKEGGR